MDLEKLAEAVFNAAKAEAEREMENEDAENIDTTQMWERSDDLEKGRFRRMAQSIVELYLKDHDAVLRNATLDQAEKAATAAYNYNAGPSVCHDLMIDAIRGLKE